MGHVQIRTTMRKHYEWLKFKSLIKSSKEVMELETYTDGRSIKSDSHFEKHI